MAADAFAADDFAADDLVTDDLVTDDLDGDASITSASLALPAICLAPVCFVTVCLAAPFDLAVAFDDSRFDVAATVALAAALVRGAAASLAAGTFFAALRAVAAGLTVRPSDFDLACAAAAAKDPEAVRLLDCSRAVSLVVGDRVVFVLAVFGGTVFGDAILTDANFEDASFEDASFEDASFEATFEDAPSVEPAEVLRPGDSAVFAVASFVLGGIAHSLADP